MSLKAVHICFIILSILLAFGVGYGATELYLKIGAFVVGGGLVYYLFRFIQKMRKLPPPSLFLACSVCFGDPQSGLSKGVIAGVLVLLGVVGFILAWIAILIFLWSRKARKMGKISPILDPAGRLD